MSIVSNSPQKDSLVDLPIAFPPIGGSSDVEIKRYKKKEEVLRQILYSFFSHKTNINAEELKQFLANRIPQGSEFNAAFFEEVFQAAGKNELGIISMYIPNN